MGRVKFKVKEIYIKSLTEEKQKKKELMKRREEKWKKKELERIKEQIVKIQERPHNSARVKDHGLLRSQQPQSSKFKIAEQEQHEKQQNLCEIAEDDVDI